ncbi:hypothetical protein [Streptomyces sp. NPDC001787]|uniref:hypothetical protein n=1 Tax=Streptomyces sp. NPDC001787 TaxID=3154523 RepID=UPI00332D1EE9
MQTIPGATPPSGAGGSTIGNLAAANLDQLAAAVKRSLKKTRYRPHLIDGCLIDTGLTLTS